MDQSTQGLTGSFFTRVKLPSKSEQLLFAPIANVQRFLLDLCETSSADMSEHSNLIRFYDGRPRISIRRIIKCQDRLVTALTEQAAV